MDTTRLTWGCPLLQSLANRSTLAICNFTSTMFFTNLEYIAKYIECELYLDVNHLIIQTSLIDII